MLRTRSLLVLSGITALALLVGTAAVAAQRPGPGRWGPWWGPGLGWGFGGLGRLNLTTEQRDQIRRVVSEQRESLRKTMQEVRRLQTELRKAILQQDSGATATLTDQLVSAYRAQLEARIAVEQQIAQTLTQEQRGQLVTALDRALERWRR